MAGVVDLRRDPAVDMANAQAIGNIFKAIGRAEQNRQKRYQMDMIVKQIAEGVDPVQALETTRSSGAAPYDNGLAGVGQRIGGLIGGSPKDYTSDFAEAILMSKLKESMQYSGLSPEQIQQSKEVQAGVRARPGVDRPSDLRLTKTDQGFAAFNPDTGEMSPLNGVKPPQTASSSTYKPLYDESGMVVGYQDLRNPGQIVDVPEGRTGNAPKQVKKNYATGADGRKYLINEQDNTASPVEGMPEKGISNTALLENQRRQEFVARQIKTLTNEYGKPLKGQEERVNRYQNQLDTLQQQIDQLESAGDQSAAEGSAVAAASPGPLFDTAGTKQTAGTSSAAPQYVQEMTKGIMAKDGSRQAQTAPTQPAANPNQSAVTTDQEVDLLGEDGKPKFRVKKPAEGMVIVVDPNDDVYYLPKDKVKDLPDGWGIYQ